MGYRPNCKLLDSFGCCTNQLRTKKFLFFFTVQDRNCVRNYPTFGECGCMPYERLSPPPAPPPAPPKRK